MNSYAESINNYPELQKEEYNLCNSLDEDYFEGLIKEDNA